MLIIGTSVLSVILLAATYLCCRNPKVRWESITILFLVTGFVLYFFVYEALIASFLSSDSSWESSIFGVVIGIGVFVFLLSMMMISRMGGGLREEVENRRIRRRRRNSRNI